MPQALVIGQDLCSVEQASGLIMPFQSKCQPGCTCGKHSNGGNKSLVIFGIIWCIAAFWEGCNPYQPQYFGGPNVQ